MKTHFVTLSIICAMTFSACTNNNQSANNENKVFGAGTFGYDLAFLKQHDSVIVLENKGEPAKIIVSPKYQAKVFTSTAQSDSGKSFGWINYKMFTAKPDPHINAFGGENRFWLGPEGGVYSLYFPKKSKMVFDNWKTPAPIDTEPWDVTEQEENSVHLQKNMKLQNYKGTTLELKADRKISILNRNKIAEQLGVQLADSLFAVGYLTSNAITNTGKVNWTEQTGMPCIWILDMFNPTPKTTIVIPYKNESAKPISAVATTDYFGDIPADRIKFDNNTLFFKVDGKSRGKLGIKPQYAEKVIGSYDAENNVLTITMFDVDANGRFLNQEWTTNKPPFSGDAVNAYNDGPLEDGSQMGPFYEIESVSPAAFLNPDETLTHNHYVFHFTGNKVALNEISLKLLKTSLDDIVKVFN